MPQRRIEKTSSLLAIARTKPPGVQRQMIIAAMGRNIALQKSGSDWSWQRRAGSPFVKEFLGQEIGGWVTSPLLPHSRPNRT
jgi:hypothetical protein